MSNLANTRKWQVTGSKENKKMFLSLLLENGIKSFNGRKTAEYIIGGGAIIKSVDLNRKGDTGTFFISADNLDNTITHFNLDHCDVEWVLEFVLKQK